MMRRMAGNRQLCWWVECMDGWSQLRTEISWEGWMDG